MKNFTTSTADVSNTRCWTHGCIQENRVAALASGDSGISFEGSTSCESGLVIPATIIAGSVSVSSISNSIVDNLTKPPEGIEPSESGMTNPLLHPADGVLSDYHDIMRTRSVHFYSCGYTIDDVRDLPQYHKLHFAPLGYGAGNRALSATEVHPVKYLRSRSASAEFHRVKLLYNQGR